MNILIVDDEYYIVQKIINDINWEKIGIDSIHTAFSAAQAKKVFEQQHIDILLTDIEMPRESGLDLIIWANELKNPPVSLILTGHQSFEYARQAIKLHCFGYILKPFLPSVLEEELSSTANAARLNPKDMTPPSSAFLINVKRYIAQNLGNEDLSRTIISEAVHMNPDYLSYLFHKEAGQSLSTYISNERMAYAQKLLTSTTLSLQSISEQTGFASTSYFHKQFKKSFGITPQQYRSMHTLE